jgi:multiple sugar transport system permease protein
VSEMRSYAQRRRALVGLLFVLPVMVSFGVFRIYPAIQTLAFSFFNVDILTHHNRFIGPANFQGLLADPTFGRAILNTLLFTVWIVSLSTIIGMVLGAFFTSNLPLAGFFKAVYFMPFITATVAAAMVWSFLYDPRFGLFNMLLRLAGLPAHRWLTSSKEALSSVIIFSVWKTVGYNMVLFVAGLKSLPGSVYEAATIDGAGALTKFFCITAPLLAPTTIFVVIYNTILALRVFDQVFVLTSGGPAEATNVVVLQIYNEAFVHFRFGYAASMALVLFVGILGITIAQFTLSRRWEVQY